MELIVRMRRYMEEQKYHIKSALYLILYAGQKFLKVRRYYPNSGTDG